MRPAARILAFAAVLAVVFALAFVAGAAIDPRGIDDPAPAKHGAPSDDKGQTRGHD